MVSGFGVSGGLLVLPAFIALRSCSVRDGESGAAKYVDVGLNVGEKVNGAALLRCEPAVDGRCELLPFEALTDIASVRNASNLAPCRAACVSS